MKVINHLGDEVMKVFQGGRDGIPHRRHLHRQPRHADRRRAEGRQDDGLRPAAESGASEHEFHKLDKAKDKNFWSVRVSSDIRLIVHKTRQPAALLRRSPRQAYDWAERRKLETHPKTGAAQLVEIRETVQEIVVPDVRGGRARPSAAPKPPLFADMTDDELLGYGVPAEWINDVRCRPTRIRFLTLADHLPAEAAEALLELATGGKPRVAAAGRAGGESRSTIPTPSAASA